MAQGTQVMRISKQGLELIKASEGFAAVPYRCPAGYMTIGYGHVLRDEQITHITEEEAEALLRKDIAEIEQAIHELVSVPLKQHEFDALVSLAYNIGITRIAGSTLLKLLNAGRRHEAAEQFGRWVYANGKPLAGLVARRNAERQLFLGEA